MLDFLLRPLIRVMFSQLSADFNLPEWIWNYHQKPSHYFQCHQQGTHRHHNFHKDSTEGIHIFALVFHDGLSISEGIMWALACFRTASTNNSDNASIEKTSATVTIGNIE